MADQAESRNGMEAQRAVIDSEAKRRGWAVEHFADEGVSGKVIGRRSETHWSYWHLVRRTA
jgi:hypothetical protein